MVVYFYYIGIVTGMILLLCIQQYKRNKRDKKCGCSIESFQAFQIVCALCKEPFEDGDYIRYYDDVDKANEAVKDTIDTLIIETDDGNYYCERCDSMKATSDGLESLLDVKH